MLLLSEVPVSVENERMRVFMVPAYLCLPFGFSLVSILVI